MLFKFIAFALTATMLFSCSEQPHPSDASLEEVFRQREAVFNQLISMTKTDSKLTRIAYDFTKTEDTAKWPRPDSELGFSKERWEQYRQLFDTLNLKGGFWRRPKSNDRYLVASTKGLVTGGSSKGFVYSTEELKPLSDNLDNIPIDLWRSSPNGIVYKNIKDNWYLYYEAN